MTNRTYKLENISSINKVKNFMREIITVRMKIIAVLMKIITFTIQIITCIRKCITVIMW